MKVKTQKMIELIIAWIIIVPISYYLFMFLNERLMAWIPLLKYILER